MDPGGKRTFAINLPLPFFVCVHHHHCLNRWTVSQQDALALLDETVLGQTRTLGPDSPYTLYTCCTLGMLQTKAGDYAGAVQRLNKTYDAQVLHYGKAAEDSRCDISRSNNVS